MRTVVRFKPDLRREIAPFYATPPAPRDYKAFRQENACDSSRHRARRRSGQRQGIANTHAARIPALDLPEETDMPLRFFSLALCACLYGASLQATAADATPPKPGRERQVECMNHFRENAQALSGTPFVNHCQRSSMPVAELAASLVAAKSAAAPAADPAKGADSLYRDCERSAWGRHFACDCVRDAYTEASAAHPGEAAMKLQERAMAGCVSREKTLANVKAECLRDPMWSHPDKPEQWCACEAEETHKALLAEPGLVLDSSGNRQLIQQRKRACQSVLPFSPFGT